MEPTLDDNFIDEGSTTITGAFTSEMTGLSASSTYYVKTYAINAADTSYGSTVEFTTLAINDPGGGTADGNNSLTFDGTDDYVDCSNSSNFEISTGTIELWFKIDQLGSRHTLAAKTLSGGFNNGFLLRIDDNSNKIWFYLESTTTYASIFSDNAILADKWYHVAVQWGSSGIKMYVNGILQSDNDAAAYPVIASGGNFTVASYYAGVSNGYIEHLDGTLDELRIWNDIRTETEIRQNMYRELPNPAGETNLVAYYNFNETSGTTSDNAEGTSTYDGTLTNMDGNERETSPAMFGPKNCLEFDGSDDYVQVPTLNPSITEGTISFWIKPKATPTNHARVLSDHWDDDEIYLYSGAGNVATWHMINGDELMSSNPLPNNQWTHVAIALGNTSSKLYINGVLDDESGPADVSISDAFEIGGYSTSGSPEVVNGYLDEFRIWSDVRTASEIREDMCKTLTGNEDNLIAYYNFDNTSGTTLQDFSGKGNDGTLTNMSNDDWVASTPFNTWLNTHLPNWELATNWSRESKPGSTDNVGVYDLSDTPPMLLGTPEVNSFVIGANTGLTLASDFSINGNLC